MSDQQELKNLFAKEQALVDQINREKSFGKNARIECELEDIRDEINQLLIKDR